MKSKTQDGANSPLVRTYIIATIQVSGRKSITVEDFSVGKAIKAGTHNYLFVLRIENFFCILLHYQINYNIAFCIFQLGKYTNKLTNQITAILIQSIWLGKYILVLTLSVLSVKKNPRIMI